MFVYKLCCCGFESSYSHLNFRFCTCIEQRISGLSGNVRVRIHCEKRTSHDENIQPLGIFQKCHPSLKNSILKSNGSAYRKTTNHCQPTTDPLTGTPLANRPPKIDPLTSALLTHWCVYFYFSGVYVAKNVSFRKKVLSNCCYPGLSNSKSFHKIKTCR